MASDSNVRRAVKRMATRVAGQRGYGWLQAAAMAVDIRAGRVREPELDLLALVRPGETVIDVGANYGFWAVPASRAVGRSGTVLAFEPIPFTAGTLRRVLRLFRAANVQVRAVACGQEPGRLALTVPVQGTGAISAGQAHFSRRDDARAGHEVHVRHPESTEVSCDVVRLDDVVGPDDQVALLKCDVEGAELDVLRGAEATLRRCHPVVVAEINPWFLEGFGTSVGELAGFLAELGYSLHRYDQGAHRLVAVDVADVVEANYVFVPEQVGDRIDAFR